MNKLKMGLLAIGVIMIAGCSESQSSDKPTASQPQKKTVQITLQTVIRQGATICSEMRSMQKVQVMERINNPYVQMPHDCHIAPHAIPVKKKGEDPMGFVIVFNENGRGLVQRKDLEAVQIRQ